MTENHDQLTDLLRAANPVAEDRLPLPAESPAAQLLYEKITGTPYTGPRPRRSLHLWRGPSGLAAVAAVVGLGVGGAVALTNHTVTRHLAVSCYVTDSLQSEFVAVDAEPDGPVATCSHAWQAGHVGKGAPPLLAACVTAEGIAAVFPTAPGADICRQLGLPALPAGANTLPVTPTTGPPPTAVTAHGLSPQLRDAIISQMRTGCLSASQAVTTIMALFTKAKVAWHVTAPTPFPVGRPCASPGFDENAATVILTGIPPPTAGR